MFKNIITLKTYCILIKSYILYILYRLKIALFVFIKAYGLTCIIDISQYQAQYENGLHLSVFKF